MLISLAIRLTSGKVETRKLGLELSILSSVANAGCKAGTGGVEPIVLMNDAVTGGGYATIGTVISADRDRLAQTKTNDKTRFRSVDLDEALEARKQRRQQMEEIKGSLT
jgi:allophanate hydrolase subunit 2